MLDIRSPELILLTRRLYPLTNISPHFSHSQPLVTTTLCFYEFSPFRFPIQEYVIVLCFALLNFTDVAFCKLKERFSTSKEITTCFIAIVWNLT